MLGVGGTSGGGSGSGPVGGEDIEAERPRDDDLAREKEDLRACTAPGPSLRPLGIIDEEEKETGGVEACVPILSV